MAHDQHHPKNKHLTDRMVGGIAFPLINVVAGFLLIESSYNWVLYLINSLVIAVALFLRPQFALGYLLSIAIVIGGAIVSGTVFLAGCFVLILGGVTLKQLFSGVSVSSLFPSILALMVALLVVVVIFLVACYLVYLVAKRMKIASPAIEWEEEPSHEKGGVPEPDIRWESELPEDKGNDHTT